jgi:hypothetical protein
MSFFVFISLNYLRNTQVHFLDLETVYRSIEERSLLKIKVVWAQLSTFS